MKQKIHGMIKKIQEAPTLREKAELMLEIADTRS